jgi:hypothetical protein
MDTQVTPSRNQNRVQGEKRPAWRDGDRMKITEVLAKLEKHESECNLRYTRIEEKLGEQKLSMKALDLKIWGLAVLIIIAPMVHKLLS